MLGTDAADGSLLTAYSPRLSDSDSGPSAASRWRSPTSVLSPHSSILSSDILGQVYEQFLGKVIRLAAGHQAKVEETRSQESRRTAARVL